MTPLLGFIICVSIGWCGQSTVYLAPQVFPSGQYCQSDGIQKHIELMLDPGEICRKDMTYSRSQSAQMNAREVNLCPRWLSGKESAQQCTRCMFNPQVGKIPWRRKWQPTSVFLPEYPIDRGAWLATVHGVTKSQT